MKRCDHRMSCRGALVLILGACALGGAYPAAASASLQLVNVATVNQPMDIESTPVRPRKLYVTSKPGQIRVINGGHVLSTPFLDITSRTYSSGEGGLISMAFDPNFATNRYFYVYYVYSTRLRFSRFQVSASNPNVAYQSTEKVIKSWEKPPDRQHLGGRIAIGPDGKLWGAIGDGGPSSIDPDPQNLGSPYGKFMRLNLDGTIPADNPFVGTPGVLPEIWAYGVRNPFKFSFDSATGDLAFADVGWDTQDEIDFQPAPGVGRGANYGWSCYEGTYFLDSTNPYCQTITQTPPVMTFSHAGLNCLSTIGGYVAHDPGTPTLDDRYVYGDYCSGDVRSVQLSSNSATDDASTGLNVTHLDTFGLDPCGRLYAAGFGGAIYRIKDSATVGTTPCD